MGIFKRRHIDKILAGEKTQTRRTHKHEWRLDRTYALRERWFGKPKSYIIITRKSKQRLGDVSLEDIRKEG